tara:strand:- start:113 stop:685 length:573 start_codon:yes stop_codon:yes gene_type:complete
MVLSKTPKSTAKKPSQKTEVKKGGKKVSPPVEVEKPKLRWFTIQGSGTGFTGGRYAAKDGVVGTASRKAGARLFRNLSEADSKNREKKGDADIKFILRETTRNSKKNTYYFKVTRICLDEPVEIAKGDIQYCIKWKYSVKSVGSTECDDITTSKVVKTTKTTKAPKTTKAAAKSGPQKDKTTKKSMKSKA